MTPNTVVPAPSRAIAYWLLFVAALIFAIVVLGGATRLTRSGLSIVEWQPLVGALPPLTEEHWLDLFEKYKQTPEYRKVNLGMDLAGFKGIFRLEYFHRLLGRLIGVAFLIPFLYFLIRRRIERAQRASGPNRGGTGCTDFARIGLSVLATFSRLLPSVGIPLKSIAMAR